ncbi:MAG: ferrochelatase [Caldilineaceae bacterium]|nr:ferrochelatase [Caldilineaceae bacterium]
MHYYGKPNFDHASRSLVGILLTNVGTPASPTARDVRPYLAQFLGDRRVIEWPRWLWLPVLHGIILRTRPRRSARLYARIWTDAGSPLLDYLRRQAAGLQELLAARSSLPVKVAVGMRYGAPSIASALRELDAAGARRILVFPLFPQYSATTTATTLDAVFDELKRWRWMPELRTINHYHDDEGYLAALEASVRESWAEHGQGQRLLLSFHGVPQSYVDNGDPYYVECQETARLLAGRLNLQEGAWGYAFQSRFGPVEWLRPYTSDVLAQWGQERLQSVDVICPGFSADCLETVDEIAHEGRETFQEAGGGRFTYIPALNARPDHIEALGRIVFERLGGWERE